MAAKQALTMLHCPHCNVSTAHRFLDKEVYPDRVYVLFGCTVCEAQQERERKVVPKKEKITYYIELVNTHEFYYDGVEGVGIIHTDKNCNEEWLRPTIEHEIGKRVSWKVGRGAWSHIVIEKRCEICFREETEC